MHGQPAHAYIPTHPLPPPLPMHFCLLHRKQLASYLPEGVIASKKRKSCPEQLRGNSVADGGVGGSRVAGSKRLSSPTPQTDSLAKRALSSGSAHLSPNGSSDLDTKPSLGADSGVGRSLSIRSDASCDVSDVRAAKLPKVGQCVELCPGVCTCTGLYIRKCFVMAAMHLLPSEGLVSSSVTCGCHF